MQRHIHLHSDSAAVRTLAQAMFDVRGSRCVGFGLGEETTDAAARHIDLAPVVDFGPELESRGLYCSDCRKNLAATQSHCCPARAGPRVDAIRLDPVAGDHHVRRR